MVEVGNRITGYLPKCWSAILALLCVFYLGESEEGGVFGRVDVSQQSAGGCAKGGFWRATILEVFYLNSMMTLHINGHLH